MYIYSTSKTEISDGRVDQLWQNNLLRSVGTVLFGLLLNINIHCLLNKISLKLAINYLLNNYYITMGRMWFCQLIEVSMESNQAQFMENLFLSDYQRKWFRQTKNGTYGRLAVA